MTAQSKPGQPGDLGPAPPSPSPGPGPGPGIDESFGPFQAASAKFLHASHSIQESVARQHARMWLDYMDEVRKTEHEGHLATTAATRKHIDATSQQPTGSPEEIYLARVRSQLEYEKEIRQIHADTQAKLAALSQSAFQESGSGDGIRQLAGQRQDAYQAYLTELQQAWSGVKALDPQTIQSIASSILFTINAANQGR